MVMVSEGVNRPLESWDARDLEQTRLILSATYRLIQVLQWNLEFTATTKSI